MAPITGDPAAYNSEDFKDGMKGQCLCGNITLEITQKGLFDKPNGHICYCYNCRQSSGASGINLLSLPTTNVKLSDPKGYLKTYVDTNTGSDRVVHRSFCSNCGSSVGCVPLAAEPKLSMVALGLFPRMPEPEFEVFTKHRHEFVTPTVAKGEQMEYAERILEYFRPLLQ